MPENSEEINIKNRMANGNPIALATLIDYYFKTYSEEVAVNKTIEQADTNPWAAVQVAEWCENNNYPNILSMEDKIPFLEKAVHCSWAAYTEQTLKDEFRLEFRNFGMSDAKPTQNNLKKINLGYGNGIYRYTVS